MQQHKNEFAAIIAADVFCYFGDLQQLLEAAASTPIIFSVETDMQTTAYQIQPNGRYKHNPQYVESLLKQAGYANVKSYPLVLRQENGVDTDGIIFAADI